jgi:hypothetical protein
MSKNTLVVLFVIFFALCGLTVWLQWRAKPIQPQGPFPGDVALAVDINEVAAFTVSSASATSRVARKDRRWVVETRHGYPADFRRIVEQLRSLAEMKVGQVVRAEAGEMAEFGLGPDQATTIRLENAAGQKLAEVRLGNPRQRQSEGGMAGMPEGIYLCVDTGPVLIVDMPLSSTFGWTDAWLNREIVNLPADSVERVSVQTKDEAYVLSVPRPGEYTVEGMASNETVESFAASRLARALSPLTLMDIADPAQDASEQGFGEASRIEFATRSGERYAVEIGGMRSQGGGRYARLSASYTKPQPPDHFEGVEPGSEEFKKKVEEFETDCADREKKISELNALFQKWVYVIPDYQVANLTLRRSELVKVEQPAEEHPAEEEAAPPTNHTEAASEITGVKDSAGQEPAAFEPEHSAEQTDGTSPSVAEKNGESTEDSVANPPTPPSADPAPEAAPVEP